MDCTMCVALADTKKLYQKWQNWKQESKTSFLDGWLVGSSMNLLFYHLPLQQNDALVTSLCMQLHFRKERSKYHWMRVCCLSPKREVLRKAKRHCCGDVKVFWSKSKPTTIGLTQSKCQNRSNRMEKFYDPKWVVHLWTRIQDWQIRSATATICIQQPKWEQDRRKLLTEENDCGYYINSCGFGLVATLLEPVNSNFFKVKLKYVFTISIVLGISK